MAACVSESACSLHGLHLHFRSYRYQAVSTCPWRCSSFLALFHRHLCSGLMGGLRQLKQPVSTCPWCCCWWSVPFRRLCCGLLFGLAGSTDKNRRRCVLTRNEHHRNLGHLR